VLALLSISLLTFSSFLLLLPIQLLFLFDGSVVVPQLDVPLVPNSIADLGVEYVPGD
jgi:hypothetical protein